MLEYRYPHFARELLFHGMSFSGGPTAGEPMPDFELTTTMGETLRKEDLLGRPALLTLGSITCPMTAASSSLLRDIYDEYGDRMTLMTLYVREAHPGDEYPQASTLEEKLRYARDYEARDEIPWTVAVDDAEGTLHRALDPKPNSFYIIDPDGNVAYRGLWSNDARTLRQGVHAVVDEGRSAVGQTQRKLVPMLSGVGMMYETLSRSGPTAERDVLRQAPPMYLMARIASVFRPLSPLARGVAAMTTTVTGAVLMGRALRALFRKR